MKKHTLSTLFAIAIALVLGSTTSAVAQDRVLAKGNVPFSFVAQGKTLPAGDYVVKQVGANIFSLRLSNGEGMAVFVASTIEGDKQQQTARLIFHRYGTRTFLSEVWTAATKYGNQLPESKEERWLKRSGVGRGVVALAMLRK